MYTTIGIYYSFSMTVCCPGWIQPGQQTVIRLYRRLYFLMMGLDSPKHVEADEIYKE